MNNAFLMTWSAKGWGVENLDNLIREFENGPTTVNWRIHARNMSRPGDKVFFLKQGQGAKGVFGYGRIIGDVILTSEPQDKNARYRVPIKIDGMVDPKSFLYVLSEEIAEVAPVNTRASGVTLSEAATKIIENRIQSGELLNVQKRLDKPWTEDELEAAIDAYLWMLDREKNSLPYSKTEVRNQYIDTRLNKRSPAAFEWRMQNISALMLEIDYPIVQGYRPAGNIGSAKPIMERLILKKLEAHLTDNKPTEDASLLNKRANSLRKQGNVKQPVNDASPARTATINKIAYVRSPTVKAWVLEQANGICEGCEASSPFVDINGLPYLEVHHVKFLSKGGPDTVENAVALCPTCHRRAHHASDREEFNDSLYNLLQRLVRY